MFSLIDPVTYNFPYHDAYHYHFQVMWTKMIALYFTNSLFDRAYYDRRRSQNYSTSENAGQIS